MRRLPLIIGLALIVALTVREFYEFFVTNEGVRYFSSEPRRLLYVVLLGLAGGLVAFGISRLSPGSQRTLKLTVLGTFGALLLGVLGLFAFHLTWAASMVSEAGIWGWLAAAFASFAVLAVLVWFEFRQVWRRT
jgi:hypothetical protein